MPLIDGVPTWREEVDGFVGVLRVPTSEAGRASASAPAGLIGEAAAMTYAISIYPNLLLIAFRTGDVHVLSWWPDGPERTEVRVQAYTHADPASIDAADSRFGAQAIERLQLEDIAVCELVQHGMRSAYYQPGPRHELEARVAGFQRAYLAALHPTTPDREGA
jgi:hypothetical protein